MTEQSQSISTDHFPCFQRVLTFLANCGLRSYTIKFSWFDQKGWQFYPFTHSYNKNKGKWFEANDEAILRQQEQASFQENVFIAHVLSYRLELDHEHYRLRYSLVSTGRRQLIRDLLAEKGITQYELANEVDEGRMLPPYQNLGEIDVCSGTVVTPTAVYGFWLDWVDGRHTLGDGRTYHHNGEEHSFWHEYAPEDVRMWHDVEEAQRRLLLRRSMAVSELSGLSEMWELREEDANQSAH